MDAVVTSFRRLDVDPEARFVRDRSYSGSPSFRAPPLPLTTGLRLAPTAGCESLNDSTRRY